MIQDFWDTPYDVRIVLDEIQVRDGVVVSENIDVYLSRSSSPISSST